MPRIRLPAVPFLLILLLFSSISNIYLVYQNYKKDIVSKVVDGDSFGLKDGKIKSYSIQKITKEAEFSLHFL